MIDQLIDELLLIEGGLNTHPEDRGGITNHGISLRYARRIGLDLDGDFDVDDEDILLVTPEIARRLYKEDFYFGPRIDRLPEPVQPVVFDMAVNHGPPRAVMILQRACNVYLNTRIVEDGIIGPKTAKAVQKVYDANGLYFLQQIYIMRVSFYREIVAKDPSQKKFLNGWLNRAKKFAPLPGS